jgi:streptogramin lyase
VTVSTATASEAQTNTSPPGTSDRSLTVGGPSASAADLAPISNPVEITKGPDNALWFTNAGNNSIGRITTAGVLTTPAYADFDSTKNIEGVNPWGITQGPGNALWFTNRGNPQPGSIGRIDATTKQVTLYTDPAIGEPQGIAEGSDGNLWFTDISNQAIGRLNSATGTVTEYVLPCEIRRPYGYPCFQADTPQEIVAGPDGNLWFTVTGYYNSNPGPGACYPSPPPCPPEYVPDSVRAISTAGVFSAPTYVGTNSGPHGITAGPDGNLWYTYALGNAIGRVIPATGENAYSTNNDINYPWSIATGPDNNLWFTNRLGNSVQSIDTNGSLHPPYTSPSISSPGGIAAGSDGALWFTNGGNNSIGKITTAGTFTFYSASSPAITSASAATFTVGTAGSFTVTATGFPAPSLSESGALPSGVTFNSATGVLSGTPAAGTGGSYPITFTARNGIGTDAVQRFTLTVNEAATITSANSATFTVGTAGSFTVTATGFPAPSLSESGALPSGVTFNSATGVLSGTPAAGTGGSYPITFTARNGIGTDAVQRFTLTVNEASQADDFGLSVTPTARTMNASTTSTTATVSTTLTSGSPQPIALSVSGLPAGASYSFNPASVSSGSSSTLTINRGTAANGTYPLTIKGTGTVASHTVPFTLTIDASKPAASLTKPTAPFVVATSTPVAWTGSDTGTGLAYYQLQYRRAPYSGGFGSWTAPSASWSHLTSTSLIMTGLSQGYTYCFHVRAVDKAGNVSAYSAARCTAVPVDDRALTASSGWTRATGSVYWNGTITKTTLLNKTLTRTSVQLDRIGVVATRCSTCGVVGVYVNGVLIGKVNLYGTLAYRVLYVLPKFSYRTGTVTLKVLTSGKQVQIDGLALTRT